jgi:hypothetical protein
MFGLVTASQIGCATERDIVGLARYPPKNHPERHDCHDDQSNYPFHFSLPLWRRRQAGDDYA